MRKPILAFFAVVTCGILLLLLVGVTKHDPLAQTLGDAPAGPVVQLEPGQEVCQQPIGLADRVDKVEFNPGTEAGHPPAVDVTLRSYHGNRVLGRGVVPAGFDVSKPQAVSVGHVRAGQVVKLCFRNAGARARVGIWGDVLNGALCTPTGGRVYSIACQPGQVRPTISTSAAFFKGAPLPGDVAAVFLRDKPRSLLTRLPLMLERASIFKPHFVTAGMWWLFIALWLVAVPALLAYAVTRASGPGPARPEGGSPIVGPQERPRT